MTTSSASFAFRLRRFVRGSRGGCVAFALAFVLVFNAVVMAAMPTAAATAPQETGSAGPCAHMASTGQPDFLDSAPLSAPAKHADGCPCCAGKTCACGPLFVMAAVPALPAVNPPPAARTRLLSPFVRTVPIVRPLRPPIA